MRKIKTILVIGMFAMIAFGAVAMGEEDKPKERIENRPPKAPVFVEEKSLWQEQVYKCAFYSIDPDGDDVYYDVDWEIVDSIQLSEHDQPDGPWFGPFESGEEIINERTCSKNTKYKLTVTPKDEHGFIGPSTTMEVKYSKARMFDLPIFSKLLERFPKIFYLFREIIKL